MLTLFQGKTTLCCERPVPEIRTHDSRGSWSRSLVSTPFGIDLEALNEIVSLQSVFRLFVRSPPLRAVPETASELMYSVFVSEACILKPLKQPFLPNHSWIVLSLASACTCWVKTVKLGYTCCDFDTFQRRVLASLLSCSICKIRFRQVGQCLK